MAMIAGLMTFLLVLALPLLLQRLFPQANPTTLITVAFFTGIIAIWTPFIYASTLPLDTRPGFLEWVYYPLWTQPAPNGHGILLLFGQPFLEYPFETTAFQIVGFAYFFSALIGITTATLIHARVGQYPVPQYISTGKFPEEPAKEVTPLPWDYQTYYLIAGMLMAASAVVAGAVLISLSFTTAGLIVATGLSLNSLLMLIIIFIYRQNSAKNRGFSEPLMTHRYTLAVIFFSLSFTLLGTQSIPYNPILKFWISTAGFFCFAIAAIYMFMGHATGPRQWGVLT
jgi:hypothetical protein